MGNCFGGFREDAPSPTSVPADSTLDHGSQIFTSHPDPQVSESQPLPDAAAQPECHHQDVQNSRATSHGETSISSSVAVESILSKAKEGLDADIEALVADINTLLYIAKKPSPASSSSDNLRVEGKWKFLDSSDLSNFKDLFSESAEAVSNLPRSLSSGQADLLISVAKTALEGIGKSHWVAAGLVAVAFVLKRFETISSNKAECLVLLEEMVKLATYLKELKKRPRLQQNMAGIMEEALTLVIQGALMCFSRSSSSFWSKFLGASVHMQRLQSLRQELNMMYTRLMLQAIICVYDANRGIQFPRQKLYPSDAVGIKNSVEQIVEMLEFESEKNVVAVIVHGFGGIGKTTLADAVYASIDNLADDFGFSKVCLFESIQSSANITEAQQTILDDITNAEGNYRKPPSYSQGQTALTDQFQVKPCFIYVDNVLKFQELGNLLPKHLDRSKKLRLLLTVRDEIIRDGLDISDRSAIKKYDVTSLPEDEATRLLKTQLSNRAAEINADDMQYMLRICGGVPLLIEMVGRYVRYEKHMNSALAVIKEERSQAFGQRFGGKTVDFFAFAFDDLEECHREAFFDICAFFGTHRWVTLKRIFGKETMRVLKKRALIKSWPFELSKGVILSTHDMLKIRVHDVILEMAKKRCESNRITTVLQFQELIQPCNYPDRLCQLKGIYLEEREERNILKLPAEKLDMMASSLRIFSTQFVNTLSGSSVTAIRVTGKCKSTFSKLIFWESPVQEVPFDTSGLVSLRSIDYRSSNSVYLHKVPGSLRSVSLRFPLEVEASAHLFLHTLSEEDDSALCQLQRLYIARYPSDEIREGLLSKLKSLRELWLSTCQRLRHIPDELHELPRLRQLVLRKSSTQLPPKLGLSTSLVSLSLQECQEFTEFPATFKRLSSLQYLRISGCRGLKEIPGDFEKLSSLKYLVLNGCSNLENLGTSFHLLPALETLGVARCPKLEATWMNVFLQMRLLKVIDVRGSSHLIQEWEKLETKPVKPKCIIGEMS